MLDPREKPPVTNAVDGQLVPVDTPPPYTYPASSSSSAQVVVVVAADQETVRRPSSPSRSTPPTPAIGVRDYTPTQTIPSTPGSSIVSFHSGTSSTTVSGRGGYGFTPRSPFPPPFSYTPATPLLTPAPTPMVSTNITRKRPPQVPRSNFIKITRKENQVRETYVIDPEMEVPEYMLSSAEGEGLSLPPPISTLSSWITSLTSPPGATVQRKNLEIICSRGINVEVWIVDGDTPYSPPCVNTAARAPIPFSTTPRPVTYDPDAKRPEGPEPPPSSPPPQPQTPFSIRKPATIYIKGEDHSEVTVNIHANVNTPFHLVAISNWGTISVGLPTCFEGPVTTCSRGGDVVIDKSLAPFITTYSDSDGTRKSFVGDIKASGYDGDPSWNGFTFSAETQRGRIRLKYVEETVDLGQKSIWNLLFGYTG